jgi:hypothetical protein
MRSENVTALTGAYTRKAGKRTTPAMAAGVARAPWSLTQLTDLLD